MSASTAHTHLSDTFIEKYIYISIWQPLLDAKSGFPIGINRVDSGKVL